MSIHHSVFYSWQSDLPKETNQVAIRGALQEAANQLEMADQSGEMRLDIDEATRNVTGSPNIPQLIFNKIDICDVFVSDLTTINALSPTGRRVANPNVLVELGYAVATIGWERIILVFNRHYGNFPDDLPFDIDRHRATSFTIINKEDEAGKADLIDILREALQEIITQSPQKPAARRQIAPEQRKREADIRSIASVLRTIHVPSFDAFLEDFPDRFPDSVFYFKDAFINVVESSTFFLYDQELLKRVLALKKDWIKSLSYPQHYGPDSIRNHYKYYIPGDEFPNDKSRKDFTYLTKHRTILQNNLRELLNYVRLQYLEIEVDALSKQAYESYKADKEQL